MVRGGTKSDELPRSGRVSRRFRVFCRERQGPVALAPPLQFKASTVLIGSNPRPLSLIWGLGLTVQRLPGHPQVSAHSITLARLTTSRPPQESALPPSTRMLAVVGIRERRADHCGKLPIGCVIRSLRAECGWQSTEAVVK